MSRRTVERRAEGVWTFTFVGLALLLLIVFFTPYWVVSIAGLVLIEVLYFTLRPFGNDKAPEP